MEVFCQLVNQLVPWWLYKGSWNSFVTLSAKVWIKATSAVESEQTMIDAREIFKFM